MRGTGGAFRIYGAQMRGLWHMFIMLACFELLTQPDGSHRRRCCVRRIIWTRALAFMAWNGCRPLQGCCGSNVRRFHRQDRRKSTLECRRGEKAFFRRPGKNEREVEIGLVFIFGCFSPRFSETSFVKNGSNITKLTPIQQCPCHSDVSQLGSRAGQSGAQA